MIKSKDIVHEAGNFWVLRSKDCYYVMVADITHSTSESAYKKDKDGLSIAIARCNYLHRRSIEKTTKELR